MRQNVFFFGVAYALSIGSVLLLGSRKDVFSKADLTGVQTTAAHKTIESAEFEPVGRANQVSAPDLDFPTFEHPQVAMVPQRGSTEVFRDSANPKSDDLPPAISLKQAVPKTRSDAAGISIALSDPFNVDDDLLAIESHGKPVPTPVEISDDELNSLAPAAQDADDAAKLATLRETTAALAKTKADLLNAKALEGEISRLQKEIANLQAARRLLDARQVLEKLIQEFPESPAADRAKSMLKALPAPRTPQDQLAPNPHISPFQSGA